jgi:hypothetical protein
MRTSACKKQRIQNSRAPERNYKKQENLNGKTQTPGASRVTIAQGENPKKNRKMRKIARGAKIHFSPHSPD